MEKCKYLSIEFIAVGGKHDLSFKVNEIINCFLLDYRDNMDKNIRLCLELIKITDIKDINYHFNNAYVLGIHLGYSGIDSRHTYYGISKNNTGAVSENQSHFKFNVWFRINGI